MAAERTPWRDNLEALAMAIVMALLLKYFVVEAYKIPSGSMQPTLMGDERSGVHDRILVDKISLRLRDPERYEVVVFKYPLDLSKNFVKRVVGIGPEQIKIHHGDIWRRDGPDDPWEHARRPEPVQRASWKRLDLLEPSTTNWFPESDGLPWTATGRRVVAEGPGRAHWGPDLAAILDGYTDGYPDPLIDEVERKPGVAVHPVGDVRVEGRVRVLPGTTHVAVELREGIRRYECRIPGPAAPEGARPTIFERWSRRLGPADDPRTLEAEEPFRLEAGRSVAFAAHNLDDRIELEIDGRRVCSLDIPYATDQRASIFLEVDGDTAGGDVGAVFEDLMALRDIYYTGGDEPFYDVPAGHYFMLGDNTQDSSDSREWRFGRYVVSDPETGEERILRANLRNDARDPWEANPSTVGRGDPEGPFTRLVDEYGEAHWFYGTYPRHAATPVEAQPFVPRRLLQGRALAVFWPLHPRLGVYRWKWIR